MGKHGPSCAANVLAHCTMPVRLVSWGCEHCGCPRRAPAPLDPAVAFLGQPARTPGEAQQGQALSELLLMWMGCYNVSA